MKKLMTICLVAAMIFAISGTANADWDLGDSAKWVQLPDLDPTGIDVLATSPMVLADDFLCTSTGPITDIHIWGSWYNDLLPKNVTGAPDSTQVAFRLTIYSDVPENTSPTGYSTPGTPLWEKYFNPGEFQTRLYASDLIEGWYDPETGFYNPQGDTQVWQYNFYLDPRNAFQQLGTDTTPIVYWLGVEAFPVFDIKTQESEPLFGWKTSTDHWNDDAVWGVPGSLWQEMLYPDGHDKEGLSIDLAFVITPEPTTICLLGLGSLVLIKRKK